VKGVRTTEEFLATPIGRYVVGRSHVIWCAAPDLAGIVMWGVPDDDDIRAMMNVKDFIRHPRLAATGCILMDCSGVERIDGEVLIRFVDLAREWLPHWAPRIARQAIVVPDGLPGLLLAGALPLLSPTYPFRFVIVVEDAIAFLDHPAAADAQAEAVAAAEAARGSSVLLARLRAALARELAHASVESCASVLGMSSRTLQRELRDRATSFSAELRRARVAAADELLRLSDVKIDAIAMRVGFGTTSRMSAALRRELGVTASALRATR
jgi:AraC-like DNA-binding protein